MIFSYHPDAQAEFVALRQIGGVEMVKGLALAVMRNNRIFDGSELLLRPKEFIGPGRIHSALFLVPYTVSLLDELKFVYEEFGAEVQVLAIDATVFGRAVGPRVGGNAVQRARRRSR
jgi:hypothetical protein